jgi:hypothetical protein
MMANPADKAAIEDAKFKAEMSRIDAGNAMTTLTEQSQQFSAGAAQALSKGMVSLAMSGNTGFQDSVAPLMPGAIGNQDPETVIKLRGDLPAMQEKLANTPSVIEDTFSYGGGSYENPEYSRLQAEIASAQEKLDVVGADVAPRIQDPAMLLRASGSDLLTMMNTREMMQRDLNTYVRSQKGASLTMLENAGHYDVAAEYAEATMRYNTLNTILGYGLKIAGLAAFL